jgi:protein SCO1
VGCVLSFAVPASARADRQGRIPDVKLIAHTGEQIAFSDLFRDRVVVVNFAYTDCRFICTPQGKTFSRLAQALGSRLGSEVVLVTVSLAPERDTPEDLAKWAEDVGGARAGWYLFTGAKKDVREVIKKMAGFVSDHTHDGSALMVHQPSRTWKRVRGTDAPAVLMQQIDGILNRSVGGAAE